MAVHINSVASASPLTALGGTIGATGDEAHFIEGVQTYTDSTNWLGGDVLDVFLAGPGWSGDWFPHQAPGEIDAAMVVWGWAGKLANFKGVNSKSIADLIWAPTRAGAGTASFCDIEDLVVRSGTLTLEADAEVAQGAGEAARVSESGELILLRGGAAPTLLEAVGRGARILTRRPADAVHAGSGALVRIEETQSDSILPALSVEDATIESNAGGAYPSLEAKGESVVDFSKIRASVTFTAAPVVLGKLTLIEPTTPGVTVTIGTPTGSGKLVRVTAP